MSKSAIGRLACAAAALIWGSGFVVMKTALDGFPVFTLLALRFAGGFLLMALVFRRRLPALRGKPLRHGLIIGVFLTSAYIAESALAPLFQSGGFFSRVIG